MCQLETLPRPGEDHTMFAHDIAAAKRGKADIASAPGAHVAIPRPDGFLG